MTRNDNDETRARRYARALVAASLAVPRGAARNAGGDVVRLRWRVQPAAPWLDAAGGRRRAEV